MERAARRMLCTRIGQERRADRNLGRTFNALALFSPTVKTDSTAMRSSM